MKWKVTSYEAEWKRAEKELADEREHAKIDCRTAYDLFNSADKERKELRKQLAAERERANRLQSQQAKIVEDAAALEQQLAAERQQWKSNHQPVEELERQLAAEKEVGHNQAVTLGQHIARLEDQLAAERERTGIAASRVINLEHEIKQLRDQLAAEREQNDDWRNTERRVAKERDEARQQLATLVDALKEFESEYPHVTRVLAKVKEDK